MTSQYNFVSLPLQDHSVINTWATLQQNISKIAFDIPVCRVLIPELQVGTLDSLLSLCDDLSKLTSIMEGTFHKLRRQIEELELATGSENQLSLTVDGIPIDSFITRFKWDDTKYPIVAPLKVTADKIRQNISQIEGDLKYKVSEYINVCTQVNARNHRNLGNLASHDLQTIIQDGDITHSQHLTTLFVVINKYFEQNWLDNYESLSPFVVPRSSTIIVEENGQILYSVVLFKTMVDKFKEAAVQQGFQVANFDCERQNQPQREQDGKRLLEESSTLRISLQKWCCTSFGETLSAWTHIIAIRLFAESVLRFGLPPAFLTIVTAPDAKHQRKIQKMLDKLCNHFRGDDNQFWTGCDEISTVGIPGEDIDLHPYVSLVMNLKD